MKLFKLNKNTWKHAHWWEKQKKDWAIEDKDGTWWIVPGSEFPEKKLQKKIPAKNVKKTSMPASFSLMLLIIVSSLLGVSLALNIIYYLLK